MYDRYSSSSSCTSSGSTVQKIFDAASHSSESLSKFKSFVAITLIFFVRVTTGAMFASLFTILGLLLTSLLYSYQPKVPILRGFELKRKFNFTFLDG